MCGIVGIYDMSGSQNAISSAPILDEMLDAISHRGPDAKNFGYITHVGFGFNRLSIIDLRNGMQPMSSRDKSIMLICNGEIFNYLELRKEFEEEGYSFKTHSDIEVLIPLYQKYQYDFLNKINGQFALALYDANKNELIIARDHFGICPLFFSIVDNIFIFASEIKALLKHPAITANVDLRGLDQLITFPGLISPITMFKNISSAEAGKYYIISKDGYKSVQYWDYEFPYEDIEASSLKYSELDYIEELEDKLSNSVKLRMRADVPIGVYLSGGLDSTLVLALMKKQLSEPSKIKSFSIDFIEAGLSEKKYHLLASDYYKTEQYSHCMSQEDIISLLSKVVFHAEHPLKETFDTASFMLSHMANKQGLKVMMAGQGADELFAGYVGYLFDSMLINRSNVDPQEANLNNKLWADKTFVYERLHKKFEDIKFKLYSDSLVDNFAEYNCLNYPVINRSNVVGRSKLSRRSYIDLKLRLADHLLSNHGDRMAMANSVEVRYPFLDRQVVDLALRMPDQLKLNYMRVKHVVKECAKKYVPEAILNREKQGFAASGSPYLLQTKSEYIFDLLSYGRIKSQGIFNPDFIEQLKLKYSVPGFKIKPPFDNDLLMPVITFSIWAELFKVKSLN